MATKFYCENCKNQVKPNDRVCPHCGRIFSAVKCPNCAYTGKGEEFLNGCPKCGYLNKDMMESEDFSDVDVYDLGFIMPQANKKPQKKGVLGGLPTWALYVFTAVLVGVFFLLLYLYFSL